MTIPEILKELEPYTGRFPMEAMQAAVEQREAITPELLRVVQAVADNPAEFAQRENYNVPLFAIYLLAQFREKRAYLPIVKMFSAPDDIPYDLVGDAVTDGLPQILASVYDGNPAPLHGLVENEEVEEFVRGSAIDAFLLLEHTGLMPRAEVVEYFRSLFHGRLQRVDSQAWNELVCAVADLPAPELLEEVRQAYKDDLVDPLYADLAGLERDIASPYPGRHDRYHLITDAIAELERWVAFHPEEDSTLGPFPKPGLSAVPQLPPDDEDAASDYKAPASEYVAPQPFVREPKVGRNDPCPCGSGKKYKKCCGKS